MDSFSRLAREMREQRQALAGCIQYRVAIGILGRLVVRCRLDRRRVLVRMDVLDDSPSLQESC